MTKTTSTRVCIFCTLLSMGDSSLTLVAALDKAEEKFGGGKVDPEKMRETNEKITDTAREKFTSMTGYAGTLILPTFLLIVSMQQGGPREVLQLNPGRRNGNRWISCGLRLGRGI